MYSDKENINILTALLVAHGVKHVVCCPGSRNSALVHNFNECPEIECHPATDERSAGFIALGLRQESGSPTAVCVTSGSALLNVIPAAAEATYQRQGIIVISADRPSAWTGQMDGQTMPQQGVLGSFAAISVTAPEVSDETTRWQCGRAINEALMENSRPTRPSVHINVPVSEPLFGYTVGELPHPQFVTRNEWKKEADKKNFARTFLAHRRRMIVAGQIEGAALPTAAIQSLSENAVILGECLSIDAQSFTEQLARLVNEEYAPETVIFLGGNTVSKTLRTFLRTLCRNAVHVTVSPDGKLHDISCHTSLVIEADEGEFLSELAVLTEGSGPSEYVDKWAGLRKKLEKRHSAFLPEYSQMLAVRLLEEKLGESDTVHYANSMSVRLGAIYASNYRHCNRGLNGIDGCLSTAAGASLAAHGRVFCVMGDLAFFYDRNALWQSELKSNFRIMLLNNCGGGIFKSLKGLEKSPAAAIVSGSANACEGIGAEAVCRQYGIKYLRAENKESLNSGIDALCSDESRQPVLLEVITTQDKDNKTYSDYFKYLADGME